MLAWLCYSLGILGVLYLSYTNGEIREWQFIPITILCLGIVFKIVVIKKLDNKKKTGTINGLEEKDRR